MPELPDLEVFKDNIFGGLSSKRLSDIRVYNPRKVNVSQNIFIDGLKEETLLNIGRVGKELYFNFSNQKTVSAHLMLNGKISIIDNADNVDTLKFKIFSFVFENETVVFTDPVGLCTIKYMPVYNGGPDTFDEKFTLEYFIKTANKKRWVNVKAFLIDQNVVKGIGNAYADEILWYAKVSPHSVVGKIPPDVMKKLFDSIKVVLNDAIMSIREISPDIISGEVRSFLKVHNKALTFTATGYPIKVEKIELKTTYYTDEQIIYS